QEQVDIDRPLAGRRAGGQRDDVDAVARVERHEPWVARRRCEGRRVARGPERLELRSHDWRLEAACSEPGVPELCDLLEDDRVRRVVPGAVLERRDPELPGDLERGVER